MARLLAVVLSLSAAAISGPDLTFVDGKQFTAHRFVSATPEKTTVALLDGSLRTWEFPTKNLVRLRFFRRRPPAKTQLYNLYLNNGGRLRGTVSGAGDRFALESKEIQGLKVALKDVRAIRFGRLLHGLQAKYDEVFRDQLERGRDAVVVQRDTRPFPITARVLAVDDKNLKVRVGDQERELPLHKVYGFVRARTSGEEREQKKGIFVRIHLDGSAHVTLPLKRITAGEWIEAGGARIRQSAADLIEFTGGHVANLADFDPISVKETALFGTARKWRRDAMVLGGPLRLEGTTYERGLGVHAYSRLEFVLSKRWKSFFVRCGIDDAAGPEGRASFRVLGDGKVLREFVGRRRGKNTSEALLIDVSDVDRLVLEVLPGEAYTSDLANWAEARVFNAESIEYPRGSPTKKKE